MIIPTVGRIVWFYPFGHPETSQPLAAIVTYVWDNYHVSLEAFYPGEGSSSYEHVRLVEDDVRDTTAEYAAWMPYQKGQAAKTEALEASQRDYTGSDRK